MPRTPNFNNCALQSCAAPTIETWLPGETLFSLASRQHTLSGNVLCTDTCFSLFGHPRIGSAHDLPARIEHFTEQTNGRFGSVSSVIYEHTLLPYYLPFRSAHVRASSLAAMAGSSIGSLKAQLGILATRFGAAHPLKACPRCIKNDEAEHRVSYWHVEHQLPGAWVCPWHNQLLEVATVKWMGINRFGWCLPADPDVSFSATVDGHRSLDLEMLQRLTVASIRLWSLPSSFHFSSDQLLQVFHEEMIRKELCTCSHRINTMRFGTSVLAITRALDSIREFAALPQSPEKCASTFSRLLSPPRSTPHPLRQIVLILSLFNDWDSFFNRYIQASPLPALSVDSVNYERLSGGSEGGFDNLDKRTQFFENLPLCKGSIHAAAERTGISVATGMAWAAAANIEIKRRGKILKPERRVNLIQALRQGMSKDNAANAFGVSKQTITTTLRTEPGLHDQWNLARFKQTRKKTRKVWINAASKLPLPTTSALRSLQPATFTWLYRHDRLWLKSFSKRISCAPPKGNHSAVRWDHRDLLLAQRISEAASTWHCQHSKGLLTNAVLCQLVPELKARLSQLAQLPRTKATLAEIPRRARLGSSYFRS